MIDDVCDRVLGQFVLGAEQGARRQGHKVLISAAHQDADDVVTAMPRSPTG